MENDITAAGGRAQRRKSTIMLGAAFTLLALIGLITVIVGVVGWIGTLLDNPTQKQQFASFVQPVAMFDPVPFESIDQADATMIQQSAVWSALLSGRSTDKYKYDDMGRLMLPSTDVDAACAKLFGPEVKLTHSTFGDMEMTYLYDEDLKAYLVPVSGFLAAYTPKVTTVVKEGDTYTITVGYLPSGTMWSTDLNGKTYEPKPDKYMLYVLKKTDTGYKITAIKDMPSESTSSQSQSGQNA